MRYLKKIALLSALSLAAWSITAQQETAYDIYHEWRADGLPQKSVVIALSGVKLRATPGFDGKVLTIIPFRETVLRKNPKIPDSVDFIFTPDSIPGHWEEVEWRGKPGFIFNAFLGQGILKMTDDYYLLLEGRGQWENGYKASLSYHYYGLFINSDTSLFTLKKVIPTFYHRYDEAGPSEQIRLEDKQHTLFIVAVKTPVFSEGSVKTFLFNKPLFAYTGRPAGPRGTQLYQTLELDIPETSLQIKSHRLPDQTVQQPGFEVWLQDKNNNKRQRLCENIPGIEDSRLLWCGDIDRDGAADFLLYSRFDPEKDMGIALFLSGQASDGQLLREVAVFNIGDGN